MPTYCLNWRIFTSVEDIRSSIFAQNGCIPHNLATLLIKFVLVNIGRLICFDGLKSFQNHYKNVKNQSYFMQKYFCKIFQLLNMSKLKHIIDFCQNYIKIDLDSWKHKTKKSTACIISLMRYFRRTPSIHILILRHCLFV